MLFSFGFSFFEVLPSPVDRGFLCQRWGIATSLVGLQSVVSSRRPAIDSFAFLFSSTLSGPLQKSGHASEQPSALQTIATVQAKLYEEELDVLGYGIIRPSMPLS